MKYSWLRKPSIWTWRKTPTLRPPIIKWHTSQKHYIEYTWNTPNRISKPIENFLSSVFAKVGDAGEVDASEEVEGDKLEVQAGENSNPRLGLVRPTWVTTRNPHGSGRDPRGSLWPTAGSNQTHLGHGCDPTVGPLWLRSFQQWRRTVMVFRWWRRMGWWAMKNKCLVKNPMFSILFHQMIFRLRVKYVLGVAKVAFYAKTAWQRLSSWL